MSHRKVGKFVCLIAFIAGLGWSQAVAAATSERDRLEKMLEEAKTKLIDSKSLTIKLSSEN